jgi:lipopolysaccharide export LptBFGC system permease protein LptF
MKSFPDCRLLRLHLAPFCLSLSGLTVLMLVEQARKQLPVLRSQGAASRDIVEVFVLSVPFIVAVTLPMAVLIAVLRVFTRLSADGEIGGKQRRGIGVLRLVAPVLVTAACIAALGFLWNDRLLPASNHRLRTLQAHIEHPDAPGGDAYRSDREMSTNELRRAATSARKEIDRAERYGQEQTVRAARQRVAMYELELQKKYAISAACLVFALFGAAVGLRLPSRGVALVLAMSTGTFTLYYVSLIAGEELADRLLMSPFVAMWSLNLFLFAVGVLVLWRVTLRGWGGDGQVAETEPSG